MVRRQGASSTEQDPLLGSEVYEPWRRRRLTSMKDERLDGCFVKDWILLPPPCAVQTLITICSFRQIIQVNLSVEQAF